MFWNHWLSRFAPCGFLNTRAAKRRTGARGVDPSLPVAAQVLELEGRVLPATIVVTTTADIINAGDGVTSLREAIIQANTNAGNDTIQLAAGTYTLTRTGANEDAASTGDLDILNNGSVTIVGAGAGLTTISAAGLNDRVLHVISGATLTVSGVTISGGTASSEGGGILSQGSTTISNSTISGNTGSYGGGIEQVGGTLVIAHSTISGNTATVNGGGIDFYQSTATITNTTISGNSAKFSGGGLFTDASTGTIANSTLTNNRADSLGGSGWHGGAISVQSGTLTLRNTIAAGNFVGTGTTANDVTGTLAGASAFNLIADSGTAGGLTNGNNGNIVGVSAEAVLSSSLANNGGPTLTHALIPGSPAINTGDPAFDTGAAPFDQRGIGFDRVLLGRVDIGAVELTVNVTTTLIVDVFADVVDFDFSPGQLSLREAVLLANEAAGDQTILLAAGTYTLSRTGANEDAASTGDLDILNNGSVTIVGPGANQTTISANGLNDRVLDVLSGAILTLDGVTITGGSDVLYGGGIQSSGTLSLNSTTISGNSANLNGGGIDHTSGILTITSSTISGNSAGNNGGGIHNLATVSVTGSTISNNMSSSAGGGIINYFGSLTVNGCTISGNTSNYGGGIEAWGGSMILSDSTISGNTANYNSGGIDLYQSTATITNTTISGNSAIFSGGGLYTEESTATISNSTLTNNRADSQGWSGYQGGAIRVQSGTLTLRNTIAVGNFVGTGTTANDVTGSLAGASAYNLIGNAGSAGGLTNGTNGNVVGVNPATVLNPALTNNGGPTLTHALIPGSLAINAGNPAFDVGGLPNDQRGAGFDRVLLGRVDIGAVEAPNTVPTLESTPNTTTFSKKAAKKNGAPQIVPNIIVSDPDNVAAAKLGGGLLIFEMELQGKQHKQKGFLSYDTIGGLEGANAIGTFDGSTQDGNRISYQFLMHAETTVEQVQSFLRGLTFSTKGKGAKVATRLFLVRVSDAVFDLSNVIEQTINVGK